MSRSRPNTARNVGRRGSERILRRTNSFDGVQIRPSSLPTSESSEDSYQLEKPCESDEPRKRCSSCTRLIVRSLRYCPFCGCEALTGAARRCCRCGERTKSGNFCTVCGSPKSPEALKLSSSSGMGTTPLTPIAPLGRSSALMQSLKAVRGGKDAMGMSNVT
eukprot:Sspe_Gene.86661::Locus_57404_Transcript_1_1_Confidence_1.000_Length_1018::g.86661::m.86661